MRISDAAILPGQDVRIIRECEFDAFYLIGKPYPDGKKTITYVSDTKYLDGFWDYCIDGVICTESVAENLKNSFHGGVAVSSDPKSVFFSLHNHYALADEENDESIIAPSARIHPSAIIDECGVVIGEDTIICANAVIHRGSCIGNNCIVREGCVVGSPAFYYFGKGSEKKQVICTGNIVLGNNVELHTGVTIEKGVLGGSTIIGENTKIDNNCLIGHDSVIGQDVIIAAGTTLAGGVELGNRCFLGVGVTIAPFVKCGEDVTLSAGAVATKSIPSGIHASGNFAINHEKYVSFIKSIT